MKNKPLVLHLDGKIVKHIEEESKKRVLIDRLAVSVASPEFSSNNDLLLGVVPVDNGKANDTAIVLQNLVEYFKISENIIAVCTDTTVINIGKKIRSN